MGGQFISTYCQGHWIFQSGKDSSGFDESNFKVLPFVFYSLHQLFEAWLITDVG
jgi:hypothetical protein